MKARLLLFIILVSCSNTEKQSQKNEHSFYFWKSNFNLDAQSLHYLKPTKKIYIKYFDVVGIDNPSPVAKINFVSNVPRYLEVIPVIYIKNEVFLNLKKDEILSFSQKVIGLINEINKRNQLNINEIQLDCDWSLKSKSTYFEVIKNIKRLSKKKISSTIRLHQIKYKEETGIPPCDEGILMFYNVGKLENPEINSIYSPKDAEGYLSKMNEYPLKLTVALPIFQWVKVFRNGKLMNLIAKFDTEILKANDKIVEVDKVTYKVLNGMYHHGVYLKKNDVLIIEEINLILLKKAAKQLKSHFDKTADVIYYDLDSFNLSRFTNEKLIEVTTIFR